MLSYEIKTICLPVSSYIEKYRDIPKFLEFCQVCPRYNKCWACPPHDFDPVSLLAPYNYVYIIGAKVLIPAELRGEVTGHEAVAAKAEAITQEARKYLDPIMLSLERTIGDALCCYGGTCYLCAACQKAKGKPCIYPDKRRSSLEALGFDVAGTTQDLLGFELLWSEESLPPYLTVVSALFTKRLVSSEEF